MGSRSILVLLLISLMLSALILAGCGGESGTEAPAGDETVDGGSSDGSGTSEGDTFTLAELAEFDGKDGRPAYVAVDGVIYDVTGSSEWPQGDHAPCDLDAAAGKDLSEVLEQAPARMRALIEAMPVVGTLE
ncbi:MAG: cytochrome b5 domain-containing protein [Actinomycetota bacterium]